ncbi:MAG: hypothetical protein A2Y25_11345 [Candidatus Melainabacteria bacterium GWF2_37_15]|nr:MAG: hypothetical protein A2Y25_11345 [Candidatus Melainabacteria bacterium GWF2_37_15]
MTENKIIKNIKITIFFVTIFLLTVLFVVVRSEADLDLWHRMAVGKIFSQIGWVIYHDIFSYFPVKEMWVDHEWLSGVIFYYIINWFGDFGILTLQILIIFAILILVYKTNKLIWLENKYRISYYAVVLLAIIPGLSSTLRCQAFTYLFFTLWLYLLERIRRGDNRFIWVFPVTTLLWANMHGGFLAGFGLIGFYIIGDFFNKKDVKKYFVILGLSLPMTLLNPYGIKYWYYLVDAVLMERPYITEWQAFEPFESIYNEPGAKLLFLFLTVGYGYKIFRKQFGFDKVEIITLLITLFLLFRHERHTTFFAIAAACYGYRYFVAFLDAIFDKFRNKVLKLIPEDRIEQAYFAKYCGVYVLLIMISGYLIFSNHISVKMDMYPVKAVEFIRKNNISGNLFVPFNWGSYTMWKLYPKNLVSIDGRYEETYESQSYLDVCYLSFFKKDWEKVLNKYNHDALLLGVETEIYKKIKTLPEWKLVYEDEKAVVFLPALSKRADWQMPVEDEEYYIKTKYENQISF